MKRLPVLLLALITLQAPAVNYYTAASGAWTAPATWVGAGVPVLSGADSIFIYHDVMYTTSISLITVTYVYIDTGASLCGHRRFIVQQGSQLDNYGDLYADSLIINGGTVVNYGFIDLTNMAVIGNGGSFQNNGTMVVGQAFLCSEKPDMIADHENSGIVGFSPNPARNGQKVLVNASNGGKNCRISLFSATGKLLVCQPLDAGGTFTPEGLSPGIYLVQVVGDDGFAGTGRLVLIE